MVKVLIIDDDPEICETFSDVLKYAAYEVHVLLSGADAFRVLPRLVPQVVLLDMQMPGVSGVVLLSFIRHLRRLARTKVIIISGHPEMALSAQQTWGADLFLSKPVHPRLLLESVASCL